MPRSWHRRKTVDTATAQQLQQQSLGLIISVLRREQYLTLPQHLLEYPIAGMARRRLQSVFCLVFNGYLAQQKRHAKTSTKCAALLRPLDGMRGESMIDMNGGNINAKLIAQTGHEMQKNSGIESAAESDPVATRRRQVLQGMEEMLPEGLRHG